MYAIACTILLLAASEYLLRGMMRLLNLTAGWPRFFALGCLSNLAVFIGVFLCGCLLGCNTFLGGPGGQGGGAPGDAPTGIEGGLNAMIMLLGFYFFLPILPIGVWMIGVAALKVAADLADMADDEGNKAADPAGKRKFFLDEDE
jgi:hypothetical protein